MTTETAVNQRQVVYWRLLGALFDHTDQAAYLETMNLELVGALGLPDTVADSRLSIDALLQRYPELKKDFDGLEAFLGDESQVDDSTTAPDLRRALLYAKLLLNVFGPNTLTPTVSAEQ